MKPMHLIEIKGVLILMFLHIKGSKVIDEHDQKGLYVEDYCPRIGVCEEGSHIMCTHYNPKEELGPACFGTINVTMTKEYADMILFSINGIRSRVARGIPLGDSAFPRGYGMFRLQWDPELATLAKLWANQCIYGQDRCRATKKYLDPGQVCSLTRFTIPDWTPIVRRNQFNYTGFSLAKVKYGIKTALEGLYRTKNSVNIEKLMNKDGRWTGYVNSILQLIQGSSTHIGCGLSIYQDFFYAEADQLIINIVRLCCNFSHRVREGDFVYNMDPPTKVGYTVKCGCPPGYDEDSGCLCYESGRGIPYSCKYGRCAPNVVLLPIFTVENAPPKNSSNLPSTRDFKALQDFTFSMGTQSRKYRTNNKSIFTKTPIFELPTRKMNHHNMSVSSIIIRDVQPRKDFTHLRDIMSSYLSKRNNNLEDLYYSNKDLHSPIDNLYSYNRNQAHSNSSRYHDNMPYHSNPMKTNSMKSYNNMLITEVYDTKLMSLLNQLEEEAKTIQLGINEKDILDKKIKKIYSKFADKLRSSRNRYVSQNNEANRLNDFEDQFNRLQSSEANYVTENIIPSNSKINVRKMIYINKKNENIKSDNLNNYNENEHEDISFSRRNYNQNDDDKLKRKQYIFGEYISKEYNADYELSSTLPSYRQSMLIHNLPRKLEYP